MNQLHRNFALIVILVMLYSGLQAQTSRWQELKPAADSSQRQWMRQVLMIDDSLITKVFSARDKMYQQVAEIRSNLSLSSVQQDSLVVIVRKDAEHAIKTILGDQNYQIYTDKIRKRLQRAGKSEYQPLTGNKD